MVGIELSEQQLDRGGLARAVGSQQRHCAARTDPQFDPVESAHWPVALGQFDQADDLAGIRAGALIAPGDVTAQSKRIFELIAGTSQLAAASERASLEQLLAQGRGPNRCRPPGFVTWNRRLGWAGASLARPAPSERPSSHVSSSASVQSIPSWQPAAQERGSARPERARRQNENGATSAATVQNTTCAAGSTAMAEPGARRDAKRSLIRARIRAPLSSPSSRAVWASLTSVTSYPRSTADRAVICTQ
jgi:hypothetical protein